MASAWTFGRIGLATSAGGDGLELPAHDAPQYAGDEIKIECDLPAPTGLTVATEKVWTAQFRGYDLNTDEPVVPLTSVNYPELDGFYRVTNVSVDDRTNFTGGIGPRLTLELLRVPGWQAPLFEIISNGADRATAHVITEWSWVATYSAAEIHAAGVRSAPVTAAVFPVSKTGIEAATLWPSGTGAKTALYDNSFEYEISAANYYKMSCWLQSTSDDVQLVSYSSWALRTVVGRQYTVAASGPPNNWRMSNGLIRIHYEGGYKIEARDSGNSTWETLTGFNVGYYDGANFVDLGAFNAVTVLRNTPEATAIRLTMDHPTVYSPVHLDLTIRRGSWVVEAVLSAVAPLQFAVEFGTAGTAVTGGIDETTAVSGNKLQLRTPSALATKVTAASHLRLSSSATSMPFAAAAATFEGNGTSTGPSTSSLYFAAMEHKQRIVTR